MSLFRKKKIQWEMSQAAWGGNQVLLNLTQGWEPFAVTYQPPTAELGVSIVWFRRQIKD